MAESIIIHFRRDDPSEIIRRIENWCGTGSHGTWAFPENDYLLLISPVDDIESDYETSELEELRAKLGGVPTFALDFQIRRSRSDEACEALERLVREDLQGLDFVVDDNMFRLISHLELENVHDFLDQYRYKKKKARPAVAQDMGPTDDTRIAGTGYELGVFLTPEGTHYLSIPVDSSYLSLSFEFPVSDFQARRLADEPELRDRLESHLHGMLLGRLTHGLKSATDEECMSAINEFVQELESP